VTQYYAGAKIVEAGPAEKDSCPGYAVRYEDGHTSWCPKEVFEEHYYAVGNDRARAQVVLGSAVGAIKEAVKNLE
jgi:hypothetical protein